MTSAYQQQRLMSIVADTCATAATAPGLFQLSPLEIRQAIRDKVSGCIKFFSPADEKAAQGKLSKKAFNADIRAALLGMNEENPNAEKNRAAYIKQMEDMIRHQAYMLRAHNFDISICTAPEHDKLLADILKPNVNPYVRDLDEQQAAPQTKEGNT